MNRSAPLVLLVDASPDCRHIFRTVLERHDYQVLDADTGNDGLRLARESVPDLVLTEWPMPVDGFDSITAGIRADPGLAGLTVVCVTAKAIPEVRARALLQGADGFLTKPILPRELLVHVRELLPAAPLAGI
jgi:two-component system, cell cycle response regulator DivK